MRPLQFIPHHRDGLRPCAADNRRSFTDHMETPLCGIDSQTSQIIWEPDLNVPAKSVNPWVQRGIEGLKANILPAAFFHDKNNAIYFSLPCKFKLSLLFQCALTVLYLNFLFKNCLIILTTYKSKYPPPDS